ncbi:Zn(2)-C6 fungal-type domain-containing protein [Fusarium sp. LHS14.1]|nr:Zn(2)-C6 fungal-type domain-containing protein [Fusarium sp. LHS14.1]
MTPTPELAPVSESGHERPKPLHRAKTACTACKARRVKCDVLEARPCWHCRNRNTRCELTESQRGKYDRSKLGKRAHGQSDAFQSNDKAGDSELAIAHDPADINSVDPYAVNAYGDGEVDSPAQGQPSTQRETPISTTTQLSPATQNARPSSAIDDGNEDGSDMLFARMADTYDSTVDRNQQPDHEASTLYLGEAFSLTFVIKAVCSPSGDISSAPKVHYPIPPSPNDHGVTSTADNPAGLDPDTMAFLRARGALTVPPKEVSDALVLTYFRCFHPAWAVLDRKGFELLYRQGGISLLLLQVVYLLAATVCDEELLRQAGFADRKDARMAFYSRAKCLYLALIHGLFQFEPAVPVSLEEDMVVNLCSRPLCRIRDEDCDIEPLCEADFAFDSETALDIVGTQEPYHVSYAISMSSLAVLMGRILALRFSPSSKPASDQLTQFGSDLEAWEEALPLDMIPKPVRQALNARFWAANLQASYQHAVILLYRPTLVVPRPGIEEAWGQRAMRAADAMTRIAEDLLTTNTLRESQLHLIPSLFAALAIHAIVIRRNRPIHHQLAENRARQCMLALGELSKSWPVGGWILRLFISLFIKLTGQDPGIGTRPQSKQPQGPAHARSSIMQPSIGNLTAAPWPQTGDAAWPIPAEVFTENTTALGFEVADNDVFDFDFMFQCPLEAWIPGELSGGTTVGVEKALVSHGQAGRALQGLDLQKWDAQ